VKIAAAAAAMAPITTVCCSHSGIFALICTRRTRIKSNRGKLPREVQPRRADQRSGTKANHQQEDELIRRGRLPKVLLDIFHILIVKNWLRKPEKPFPWSHLRPNTAFLRRLRYPLKFEYTADSAKHIPFDWTGPEPYRPPL
jgi:hypothetical protein